MRTGLTDLALLGTLMSALFVTGTAAAEKEAVSQNVVPAAGGLTGLFDAVGKLPSLSGLIKPEKMGLLADNQCRVHDNQAQLLSENKTDVNLMSGNVANVLSGIHFLSDISVEVHITVRNDNGKASSLKAGKGPGKSKSRKAAKHDAARKPKD